jgi:hypothetical protein
LGCDSRYLHEMMVVKSVGPRAVVQGGRHPHAVGRDVQNELSGERVEFARERYREVLSGGLTS